MPNLLMILRFYYAIFLMKKKKNFKKAYLTVKKITKTKNVSPHITGTAYLLMVDILDEMEIKIQNDLFSEIEEIITSKQNLDLINDLDFTLAVSSAYYQRIIKEMPSITDKKKQSWLSIADFYRKRAETMYPKKSDIIRTILHCLNVYVYIENYREALGLCKKSLKDYQKVLQKEQRETILFFTARSYMGLGEYEAAFKIYKNIISEFTKNEELWSNNLFHIFYDLGRYFESIVDDKQALENYKRSLAILEKGNGEDIRKQEKESLLRDKIVNLEQKISNKKN